MYFSLTHLEVTDTESHLGSSSNLIAESVSQFEVVATGGSTGWETVVGRTEGTAFGRIRRLKTEQ